jgi:hypothetical protein
MQTYSVDFFLMALFTRKAYRGVSVAEGGVSPASGVVPATATLTAAAADGAAPTSSGLVWRKRRKDYKWILLARHNIDIRQYDKAAGQYPEDSISCAFRLRTTRRPCGTKGRASVNSMAGPEELFCLASPLASFSTRGLSSSVDSLLRWAAAMRALFASTAALGRRWSGRGISGCGG